MLLPYNGYFNYKSGYIVPVRIPSCNLESYLRKCNDVD